MQDYSIAGHIIRVFGEGLNKRGFTKFQSAPKEEMLLLMVTINKVLDDWDDTPLYHFVVEGIVCDFLKKGHKYLLRIVPPGSCPLLMEVYYTPEEAIFKAITNMDANTPTRELHFAIWIAFGIAALCKQTISIHASTIIHNDKAILFLGESGTGKSTHTRLWLKHISDTELLNDDSPFIQINQNDNSVSAWGSPWSGKTPCYKNIKIPVAAIVRLKQAPFNKIRKLNKLEAIGALLPSCPPAFTFDETLSEHVYEILSIVIGLIPLYSLECLPNEKAAQLVYTTLQKEGLL